MPLLDSIDLPWLNLSQRHRVGKIDRRTAWKYSARALGVSQDDVYEGNGTGSGGALYSLAPTLSNYFYQF